MKPDSKIIFFDFDGVILDSVEAKTEAFRKLFSPYGAKIVQKVVDYHLSNGGMSRFQKFEYYYRELLGRRLPEKEKESLNRAFSRDVMEGVLAADFVPGALVYLQSLYASSVTTVLISATPEPELFDILIRRDLMRFFDEVHGAPKEKARVMEECLIRYAVKPCESLFYGDAVNDLNASLEVKVPFVGVVQEGRFNPFGSDVRTISGFLR